MKYIALLRGINISGKSKIYMKELKKEIENIDFDEVITYLIVEMLFSKAI